MAINYTKIFNRRATPQSQPIPGSTQVANSAGGYSWRVDDWTRFDRFLILGAEGGTYYIAERDLVRQNHDAVDRCREFDRAAGLIQIVNFRAGETLLSPPACLFASLASLNLFRWPSTRT